MYRIPLATLLLLFSFSPGEVSVNSPANVDELLGQIVDLIAEQQKNTLWELDLP